MQNKDKFDRRVLNLRYLEQGAPMDVVRIFDTTLRDGEQSPGFFMNTEEKIRMAKQLAALNVDIIEAGFPRSPQRDPLKVQAVVKKGRTLSILALTPAKKKAIGSSP